MLNKHKAYEYIMQKTVPMTLTRQSEQLNRLLEYAYRLYNIPRGIITDIPTKRVEETEATKSSFVMFGIIDALDDMQKTNIKQKFFTEIELREFPEMKFQEEKLTFPWRVPMIQVAEDQWIGSIDMDTLNLLRNASMIKYNPDTQRALKKIINGDDIQYEINVHESVVKEVQKFYHDFKYIPNTLSLNMGENSNEDFYYDDNAKELVIEQLDHFDMSDGYHRYYGACREKDQNPDFNTTFELRVTHFDATKARQFIFQEDLKTHLSKIESAGMNMNAPENLICERLNKDITCNFIGKIDRNKGTINLSEFAMIIRGYYLKNRRNVKQFEIASLAKEISQQLNIISDEYPEYIDKRWNFWELLVLCNYMKRINTKEDAQKVLPLIPAKVEGATVELKSLHRAMSPYVLEKVNTYIES